MLRVRRAHPHQIAQLAIHFSYNQTFIPVQGSLILVVAPAPDRQSADPSTYTFDYDHAAAFVVEPGQVAFIEKGVWHSLVPVARSVRLSTSHARTRRSPRQKRAMKPAWSAFTRRVPMWTMWIWQCAISACWPWNGEETRARQRRVLVLSQICFFERFRESRARPCTLPSAL